MMWKVTFGRNVDIVQVEAETIVEAIGKARKWSDEHLMEEDFTEEDRAITEATLVLRDWLR